MGKIWDNLSRLDTFLIAAGVLAAMLYFVILPRVSPDGLVARHFTDEEVAEIAHEFVKSHGGSVDDMAQDVSFKQDNELLKIVQRQGRRSLREALVERGLPGYYHEVQFNRINNDPSKIELSNQYTVKISTSGVVWHYNNRTGSEELTDAPPGSLGEDSRPFVDRNALFNAFSQDSTLLPQLETLMSLDDDSLARIIRVDLRSIRARQVRNNAQPDVLPPGPEPIPARPGSLSEPPRDQQRRSRNLLLSADDIVAIASYHAEKSSFDSRAGVPDSIWAESGVGAGVQFLSRHDSLGVIEQMDVHVTHLGALKQIDHRFLAVTPSSKSPLATTRSIVSILVFFLVSALLVVVFFRQLLIRAIDVRAALLDAVVFSILFVVFLLMSTDLFSPELPTWMRLAGILATLAIGGGAMALIVFLASSASDSLIRRKLSGRLKTVSLIRQGSMMNTLVGGAVVRGVAIGFIALACSAICLAIFSDAAIEFEGKSFANGALQPYVAAVAYSGWSAYFKSLLLILTVGAITYKKGRSMWLVVVPIALVYAITGGAAVEFTNVWLSWVAGAVIGLIFAISFWYFDGFVVFVGLTVFSLMSALQEGWLMEGSPILMDAGLGLLTIGGMLVFGFIGVSKGRPGNSTVEYVPQYIREMGEQKQLQRELEIARQVQESFLPKRMPVFNGLDIAATCIPAELVGGDYYDFVSLSPDRLGIALGDVSGKGIQAAFFMTLTKGFLRAACRESNSPASVLDKVNSLFRDSAPRGTFISLVYGILDFNTQTFTFGRAGHNPVILKRRGEAESTLMQPSGVGIGLASPMLFGDAMAEQVVQMNPGDLIVLFTDGFSEARNFSHDEYGDERLARIVTQYADQSAQIILDEICADVVSFCQSESTHDDRTVMVVKWPDETA